MRTNFIKLIVILLVIWVVQAPLQGAPLHPETIKKLSEEGRLQDYLEMIKEAQARGVDQPEARPAARSLRTDFNADGVDTATVLVILVDFDDNPWITGYVSPDPYEFDSLLFSDDFYNPTGSMTDYYKENSYGKFVVTGNAVGPFRMPHDYSYYTNEQGGLGSYPQNSQGLVVDAVVLADAAGVDFSQYDTWGPDGTPDGMVDAVMIVHSGPGGEGTGNENDIHSHKWSLGIFAENRDGVEIDVFTVQPEENQNIGEISSIGIFAHEYGHVLGLPDLYDIDYIPETSYGIGIWSLMASGTYNHDGKVPAHLDAWCKVAVGFVTPIEVSSNMTAAEIPQVESEPAIYKLWRDGVYENEYFLVENRQKVGFDTYLPGGGLLIYHVDDNATFSNQNVEYYHVALEQADGYEQIEYAGGNDGDDDDPFPGGTDNHSFDDLSAPNSRAYDGTSSQVAVWDISDSDSLMTANLDINWSRPYFSIDSVLIQDGNTDDVIDIGNPAALKFYIENKWMSVIDVELTVTNATVPINYSNQSVTIDAVPGDGAITFINTSPINLTVPPDIDPTFDSFFVDITYNGGIPGGTFILEKQIGQSRILIVDADRGDPYDTAFTVDLYNLRKPADVWDKTINGTPPGVILSLYDDVIWMTGDTADDYVDANDIAAMTYYMDNGGNFMLTGQGLGQEFLEKDSAFMANYLKSVFQGYQFTNTYEGVDGNAVFDGVKFRLVSYNHQYYATAEEILPMNGGKAAIYYRNIGGYVGVTYHGDYKLVFLDFGYEDLDISNYRYNSRDTLMARVLKFFSPDFVTDIGDEGDALSNLPEGFRLDQNYPNPFNPTTTISYAIPYKANSGNTKTTLTVYNILGREVKTLVDSEQSPGQYSITWDGTNQRGESVTSGVYFYRLIHDNEDLTKKMLLLK